MIVALLKSIKDFHNVSWLGTIVGALRFTALGDAVNTLPYTILALQLFAITAFVRSSNGAQGGIVSQFQTFDK